MGIFYVSFVRELINAINITLSHHHDGHQVEGCILSLFQRSVIMARIDLGFIRFLHIADKCRFWKIPT